MIPAVHICNVHAIIQDLGSGVFGKIDNLQSGVADFAIQPERIAG